MAEPVSLIMRQFLAWVAERPRRREEVREAWRSCPRISVWEDAVTEELVAYDGGGLIGLTARGRAALGTDVSDHMSLVGRPVAALV
jgi:hypothetical protein